VQHTVNSSADLIHFKFSYHRQAIEFTHKLGKCHAL